MTPAEYGSYQLLIIGDPDCNNTPESVDNSAHLWTPVVMGSGGNRTVVGTDPEFHYAGGHHGAEHLVQDGIAFAGAREGATGVYFDTSCSDELPLTSEEVAEGLEGTRDVNDILNHLTSFPAKGAWTENTSPPCGGSVQQVAANPFFDEGATKLLDTDIEGWSCSDHITFPSFPADWFPLAVATDTSTLPTCGTDPENGSEVCGQAYVLLAGSGIKATAPNLSLTPETHEDPAGVNNTHTVTANVHAAGKPIAGVQVTFSVTGTNNGVTGSCSTSECKTDENGNVSFTYADANGAGSDQIIAGASIEHEVEHEETSSEDIRPAAVTVKVTSVEQATANELWVQPAATTTTTTTTTTAKSSVLPVKETVKPTGSAHLASSGRACVASSGYVASVSGKGIASVTYTLDGHRLKTLRHASHGAYALRIQVSSRRAHHLSIHVTFSSAAHTSAVTLHKTLARCAAHIVLPRFTG
jgi:hypothetical protein